MNIARLERKAQNLLDYADVKINGSRPWDLKINNKAVYQRFFSQGSLGFGESYIDRDWDCEKLDSFFYRVLKADLEKKFKTRFLFDILKIKLMNLQSKKRAFQVGEKHYDIGNDIYKAMLDKRMVYSSGYWKDVDNLDDAQESKLELVCKKIGLEKGMNVLDIGCGWGSFAKYASEIHKANVVGVTVSKEQVELGNELCKGLPVEIKLQDYRDLNEKFDRIVSLGMFEHVGPKNYREYMEMVNRSLNDDGLFLLHTIGTNNPTGITDKWIDKYIFPNGVLPSAKQIVDSIEGLFVIEDWHNFRKDYDKTLMAWHNNFEKNWNKIKENYNEKFKRMWDYYLLSTSAGFRVGNKFQLWQIVFSKKGVEQGYVSIR